MSIASILGLTGSTHAAFSTRAATSTASEELQKLFAKLHMDAIATTTTTSTSSTTSATSTATTTPTSAVTGIASGLRHLLDGGLTVAKDARSAAKAVTGYTHGAGLGRLASQVLDKVA